MGLVLDILDNEVRKKIAAADTVLTETRARRNLVGESAMGMEGSLRWFRSGSVAHAHGQQAGKRRRRRSRPRPALTIPLSAPTATTKGQRRSSMTSANWSGPKCGRSTQRRRSASRGAASWPSSTSR